MLGSLVDLSTCKFLPEGLLEGRTWLPEVGKQGQLWKLCLFPCLFHALSVSCLSRAEHLFSAQASHHVASGLEPARH